MDDGVVLRAYARQPRDSACSTAVVLIPPGFEWGLRQVDQPIADALLQRGVAVFSFDPRGRGYSGGSEDANGPRGQDDLAAVLRWVASQEQVDPTGVELSSRSFGGALAAGALGRHGDLAVVGWVDVESPGYLREDLEYAPDANLARFEALLPEDGAEAWWEAREPARLITTVAAPYHRFQGIPDHALGERTLHAVAMLEAAGDSAELRYNGRVVEREEVTPTMVQEEALPGVLDPNGEEVLEGVLDYLR